MAIHAIAIVHVDPTTLKAALDPGPEEERAKLTDDRLDVVEGADGKPYVIECFEDATALRLGIPLGYAEPEMMGTLIAAALGDLVDAHDDPRGIPLYPDSYRPKARTWAELLEEIGEALDWAPIEGPEIVDPMQEMQGGMGGLGPEAGDLVAMAAQMQAQLPPEMLQQAMQMAQRLAETGAMDEIQRAMQGMDPSAEVDFEAMAQRAQEMLEGDPELKKRLTEQLGITDAKIDDEEEE